MNARNTQGIGEGAATIPGQVVPEIEDSSVELIEPSSKDIPGQPGDEVLPADHDLLDCERLGRMLDARGVEAIDLLAGGDVMLGGRTRAYVARHGYRYPFAAARGLLARAAVVFVNLEGPFARKAAKVDRTFCHRVNPALTRALAEAGVNVVSLANNHILDCGRAGVLETLEVLESWRIAAVGAGMNSAAAHRPRIVHAGGKSLAFLAYYWNERCGAAQELPGAALDAPDRIAADILHVRPMVDHIIVSFHWGVAYDRTPSEDDRWKARLAIDCGADAVIGSHPHVVQPFEIHRNRPIFYSLGNFAFGSNTTRSEGMLVGFRFQTSRTLLSLFPLHVRNGDPRVANQPKLLRGAAGERLLDGLRTQSGASGRLLRIEDGWGSIELEQAPRERSRG